MAEARSLPARPGSRLFVVVAWGLAFHVLAMVLLFARSGLPTEQLRIVAAWKEMAVVGLGLWTAARIASGRVGDLPARAPDLIAAALVAVAVVHALASLAGLGPATELTGLVYGLRDVGLGFVLYAVGRTTPAIATGRRALGALFAIGVVTSAIAVYEWMVVTPEQLVLLGVASYVTEFLGAAEFVRDNPFGLPTNYWTRVGGRVLQRAGSVHMSSQGFAIPFLLIMPAATAWLTLTRRWRSVPAVAAYALCWAGLLLTITRVTIVACLLQAVFLLVIWRRPGVVLGLGIVGSAVIAGLLLAVPGLAGFVWETVTWQSGSSASHSKDYYDGLIALVEQPLGAGLGTADMTAVRLGRRPLTNDNLHLKYAVELGVAGLLLFEAWLGTVLWTTTRAAMDGARTTGRVFCGFAAACVVGVAANGMTAVVFNAPMLTYLFFWCVGAAVTVASTPAARDR